MQKVKNLNPFYSRIGGKQFSKNLIVPLIPLDIDTYVECFFGAGSVFFRREQKPLKEVVNDLDEDIYLILDGVKNDPNFNKEINRKLDNAYFTSIKESKKPTHIFERLKTSYFGKGKSYCDSKGRINTNTDFYKERLKDVEINNKDFKEIIEQHKDNPKAFFYLDPPYECSLNRKDYYKHSTVQPIDVLNAVKNIKGRFLITYNDSENIRHVFKDYKIETYKTIYAGTQYVKSRDINEIIIRNY
jgi:DNA adenine methylase